jgi:hypothetical protein
MEQGVRLGEKKREQTNQPNRKKKKQGLKRLDNGSIPQRCMHTVVANHLNRRLWLL